MEPWEQSISPRQNPPHTGFEVRMKNGMVISWGKPATKQMWLLILTPLYFMWSPMDHGETLPFSYLELTWKPFCLLRRDVSHLIGNLMNQLSCLRLICGCVNPWFFRSPTVFSLCRQHSFHQTYGNIPGLSSSCFRKNESPPSIWEYVGLNILLNCSI